MKVLEKVLQNVQGVQQKYRWSSQPADLFRYSGKKIIFVCPVLCTGTNIYVGQIKVKLYARYFSVSDPDPFYADPDLAFSTNADQDLGFKRLQIRILLKRYQILTKDKKR
jgi:hypothetical protein